MEGDIRVQTSDLDIQVPREMVAQEPIEPRDHSKLLVLHRATGEIEHRRFYDLPKYLGKGDCLVFNNSRVIPARLRGTISGKPMEEVVVLLLKKCEDETWEALVEVGEVDTDQVVDFRGFTGKVWNLGEKIGKRKERIINIFIPNEEAVEKAGEPPVPPYIHGYKGDPERYQTVYSQIRGSAAAPTAGLHFTDNLLNELRGKGVTLAFVTLHVGIDTFMPILEEKPEQHKMYTEFCQVEVETAKIINETRKRGNKVIGVGTTSVRTLESAHYNGYVAEYKDWTSIYMLPGYQFKSIDHMLTNFHYPRSTNLGMVAAFAGLDNIRRAYEEAVKEGYRFYSFGDSCLLL